MLTRAILASHPVSSLKAELKKAKTSLNYGRLKKNEIIDLMLKNKALFDHITYYKKVTFSDKPEVKTYKLSAKEKAEKKKSDLPNVKNCPKKSKIKEELKKNPDSVFPCKKKETVFKSEKSYDRYLKLRENRKEARRKIEKK